MKVEKVITITIDEQGEIEMLAAIAELARQAISKKAVNFDLAGCTKEAADRFLEKLSDATS